MALLPPIGTAPNLDPSALGLLRPAALATAASISWRTEPFSVALRPSGLNDPPRFHAASLVHA